MIAATPSLTPAANAATVLRHACVLLECSRVLRICPPRFEDSVSAVVAPPLSLCRSPPSPPTVSRPLLRVSRVLPLTRRLSVGLIVHDTINSMGIPLSTCRASAGPGSQPAAGGQAPAPTAHNNESKPEGSDSTLSGTAVESIPPEGQGQGQGLTTSVLLPGL